MNNNRKEAYLNNLRRRFPRKSCGQNFDNSKRRFYKGNTDQTENFVKIEVVEFWLGDRGTSIYNNRLDSKEHNIPQEETHDYIQYGHGIPIMIWIPKFSCGAENMKKKEDKRR